MEANNSILKDIKKVNGIICYVTMERRVRKVPVLGINDSRCLKNELYLIFKNETNSSDNIISDLFGTLKECLKMDRHLEILIFVIKNIL